MSNSDYGSNSQRSSEPAPMDPAIPSGQRSPLSGSGSENASIILHNSGGSEELKHSQLAESMIEETPGRPDRSISEYADAYVKMMEARESGQLLQNEYNTPLEDGPKVSQGSLKSSDGPPLLLPPPSASNSYSSNDSRYASRVGRESPPNAASSSAMSPVFPRSSSEASSAPIASSSSAPRRDTVDNSNFKSVNGQGNLVVPAANRHHRRRSSAPLVLDDELDDQYMEEEDIVFEPKMRSSANRGILRSGGGRGAASRASAVPSASSGANGSKHVSLVDANSAAEARGSQRYWHSRKNSSASNASSGSDSPASSKKMDSPRGDVGTSSNRPVPKAITAGGITYAPALKRSSGSGQSMSASGSNGVNTYERNGARMSKQQETTTSNLSNAKATLFYIRRRINMLRAFSLIFLILTLTLTTIAWSFTAAPLIRSQQAKTTGCASSFRTPIESLEPQAPTNTPATHSCPYFYHDMTSFLVVTGIWLAASLSLAICNVSASFMFYWRRLTQLTLVFNLSMLAASVVVLNWVIVLLAFAHEPENWRFIGRSSSSGSSTPSNGITTFEYWADGNDANLLKTSSILLCVAVSISWVLCFFISLLLRQLRRFIMSKPRYCCWPLEGFCCSPTHPRLTGGRRRRFPLTGFRSPSSDLHLEDDDLIQLEDLQHMNSKPSRADQRLAQDPSSIPEDDALDLPLSDSRSSNSPQNSMRNSQQQQSIPNTDFAPILESLQGIQSTVSSLAKKVQVIEQREANAAPAAYADPFAYGRQPPRF